MIPKKIHYCWFGRNPLPKLAVKCIKSWKKYCKGYEIIEWNEDNFSIEDAPLYVRQAYEAKKWAFVTDYVRLYAMVTYGGIYMDTDVEVVKPLDKYLEHQAFSGFENETSIPTGIMACEKDFPLFVELLQYYDNAKFINEDGSLNMTTNVAVITEMCKERGFVANGEFQVVEGFVLYPRDFFCPASPGSIEKHKSKNTVTIHWFAGSWLDEKTKKEKEDWILHQNRRKVEKRNKQIKKLPKTIIKKILGNKLYEKIKLIILKSN